MPLNANSLIFVMDGCGEILQTVTLVPSVSKCSPPMQSERCARCWAPMHVVWCWPSITISLVGFSQTNSSKHFWHFAPIGYSLQSASQMGSFESITQWAAEITFRELISDPPHVLVLPDVSVEITATCQGIECGVISYPPGFLELFAFSFILDLPHSIDVNLDTCNFG